MNAKTCSVCGRQLLAEDRQDTPEGPRHRSCLARTDEALSSARWRLGLSWVDPAASGPPVFVPGEPGMIDVRRSNVVLADLPSYPDQMPIAMVHYDRAPADLRKALRAHCDAPPPFGDVKFGYALAMPAPFQSDDLPRLEVSFTFGAPRPAQTRKLTFPLTDEACVLPVMALRTGAMVMVHSHVGPTWQAPELLDYVCVLPGREEGRPDIGEMLSLACITSSIVGLRLPVAEAILKLEGVQS